MRRLWGLVGVVGIAGACAATGSPASRSPATEVAATRYFELHSDPWINLHHFLYQWTRADLELGSGRQEVVVAERSNPDLTGEDAEAWGAALELYRDQLASRGHFDDDLLQLKADLLALDGALDTELPEAVPGQARVLAGAMAVYQRTWWPTHDQENRRWIASVLELVERYEGEWVETASRVFGGSWGDQPLRVDASAYANWAGGYTSNGPDHTVVWSTDDMNNRGLYGFEILLHESGHMRSLSSPFRRRLREAFAESDARAPNNLSHAMLFATAGYFVAEVAASEGLPLHVPYVVDQGLSEFSGWREVWPTVEELWVPVVRGDADPEVTIDNIARALAR